MSNDKNNSNANDLTWARSLVQSDQAAEPAKGPSNWERTAAALAGVAAFTGEFVKEQAFQAGQDLVSRVLLEESYSPPQPGEKDREQEHDKDQGIDR